VRPAQVHRVRVDGEGLRGAVADQQPKREPVATGDVDQKRRVVSGRSGEQLSAEDVGGFSLQPPWA
jgi:hypothetical protein